MLTNTRGKRDLVKLRALAKPDKIECSEPLIPYYSFPCLIFDLRLTSWLILSFCHVITRMVKKARVARCFGRYPAFCDVVRALILYVFSFSLRLSYAYQTVDHLSDAHCHER